MTALASSSVRKYLFRLLVTLIVLLLISVVLVPVYSAGTVTDCSAYDDSNPGDGADTLAEALVGGGSVTFNCSGTIIVPEIGITSTVTIDATGQTVILDGNNANRIFNVNSGGSLTLINLRVRNGFGFDGGGIYNMGTLTLTNSTVSGNDALGRGGGIYNAPGRTVTLTNSNVSGNTAQDIGGRGGGIYNAPGGTVTLTNSIVSGNSADVDGGGIYSDSIGTLTLTNSTLLGNSADMGGGGIHNSGTLTLTNSTLLGNSASQNGGGIYNGGTLNVTNSTVSGNSASQNGGGIYNGGTLNVTNAIIANSPGGGDCVNASGTINPSGGNLIEDGSCSVAGALSGDPLLGALTGSPAYFPLQPGSPAIDTGSNCPPPATDQRGATRPQDGDGNGTATCDLGSYEADAASPADTDTPTPTPTETPTDAPTATATDTPTDTPTSTPTDTPTGTLPPTDTPSPTPTETPTGTLPPTDTPSPTPTHTLSPTPLPTATFPPPPPALHAEDVNFDDDAAVRTGISDSLVDSINIRVLYWNGRPTQWLGYDLYNAGSIGVEGLFDLGVQQAVDIFSPVGRTYFEGGAVFCLRGRGTLIWLAASGMPRHAEIIGSYEVPEFPGFTCATLFEPGTLVLVSQNPMS